MASAPFDWVNNPNVQHLSPQERVDILTAQLSQAFRPPAVTQAMRDQIKELEKLIPGRVQEPLW